MHAQQDIAWKTARLENAVEIMVPQFIEAGDVIRLDAEHPKYFERAKAPAR